MERFLGSRVHEALEALYLNVRFGRIPSLENLLDFLRKAWQEAWHDDVLIQQSDLTADDYRRASAADPVGWVDQLGELKDQRKATLAELDAEIEALERRIADYAAEEGLEAVFGATYYARVRRSERVRYPLTDDPRRQELEDVLRRHRRWGEVSALDIRALPSRVRSGEWPPELVQAVLPFETRGETVTVRISKRPNAG